MPPKNFPVRCVVYTGPHRGRVVATLWHAFGGDWIDHAETMAERMANEWNAEIDIETGSVMPSGNVGSWDRIGMRVAPF